MNASLLLALALIVGFAHLSSQQRMQQSSLGHSILGPPQVGDVLAAMSTDGTYEMLDSQVPTNCPILLTDLNVRQTCSLAILACQQYLAKDRTTVLVSKLINPEPQVVPPSRRPILTHCTGLLVFNSFSIRSAASASACS
jgi:hypothetical protein